MWWLTLLAACSTSPPDRRQLGATEPGSTEVDPYYSNRGLFSELRGLTPELPADETWPVVIVGGGVAGLAVATQLGEGLLLEGESELGGRALLAGGLLYLVDSPAQDEGGVEDSLDLALEDWPLLTGEEASEAALLWMGAHGEIYDRLESLGLEFGALDEDPVLHRSRAISVNGGGAALVDALAAALPTGVEARLQTWVDSVWMKDGRAVGVVLADGARVAADAVVIASGGFASNAARVARLDAVANLDYGAWAEATDDGAAGVALDWADAHGWATAELSSMGWFRRYIGAPGVDGRPMSISTRELVPWVWVNGQGLRFVDESIHGSVMFTVPYDEQDVVWGVIPSHELAARVSADNLPYVEAALEEGRAIRCEDSVERLADAIGVDPEALAATLEEVVTVRDSDGVDPFLRSGASFPDFQLSPPCAFAPGLVAAKSFGGLAVDLEGRVLDRSGQPVPGLYAVGEAAGMGVPGLGGRSGFDGSLSAVLWSGWRVGDRLAGLGG